MANKPKCYNSLSCILSIAVIFFILGAILIDIFYTKPEMRETIEEIRIEVRDIHQKIDIQSELMQKNRIIVDTVEIEVPDSI